MNVTDVLILGGLLCSPPLVALAQTEDPHDAQPERPTVATHAGTVAPGWLEVEAGGESDRYDDHSHGAVVPVTIKLGLASNVQWSVFASAVQVPGSTSFEPGDFSLGIKWRIADELPVLGRFALLPTIKFPTGSTATGAGTGTTDGTILLISSNDLKVMALDINLAYTRRTGDGTQAPRNATLWTASLGGPGIGDLGWTVELYGYPGTSGPAGRPPVVAALFGPTLTFKSWLVFDAGLVEPVAGPQPHAVYLGAVWNIGYLGHENGAE